MTKNFPPLYKRSSGGALLVWQIAVEDTTILTVHGQYGGAQQVSQDTIKEGKNTGKANATTPETQALVEAQAKWLKQKKRGYVEDKEAAAAGEVDTSIILGGIAPMLSINQSHPADPILAKYLRYPCMEQPKLDGARCIVVLENGKVSLWTRTRKPITSMPHIVAELERLFPEETLIFDGELYNHEYKDRFEDLISIIRKAEPDPEGLHKVVQLHVYDLPQSEKYNVTFETPYQVRFDKYQEILRDPRQGDLWSKTIVPVEALWCDSFEELLASYEERLLDGYEGSMAKNLDAPYASGKRSHDILKMKEFVDGEAEILEVLDGRGKDAGVASKFRCLFKPPDGRPAVIVEPVMKCSYAEKKRLWDRRAELVGKMLTIKYKRLTADGVPYIPTGKSVRDYE